ncbi:MAG: hypothetical protein GX221_11800 [Candidatus Riflebacteria bacterium]|nr:hypothetical protein [Candidatus Riflebacteria bacterium]
MAISYCPRCERGTLNHNGSCKQCGYQVRRRCTSCGFTNVQYARYCGGCGQAMSEFRRIYKSLDKKVSFVQAMNIKKFASGLFFGLLLVIFAFGSMGMKRFVEDIDIPHTETTPEFVRPSFESANMKGFKNEVQGFFEEKDLSQRANLEDLFAIMDGMMKQLNPKLKYLVRDRYPLDTALEYYNKIQNFPKTENISKGMAYLMMFSYASDLFELKYGNFADKSLYKNIPKFHFMAAPAAALDSIGIRSADENGNLDLNSDISIESLCDMASAIIVTADKRLFL